MSDPVPEAAPAKPATGKPPSLGTVLAWSAGGVVVMGLGAGYGIACYQFYATAFPGPQTGMSHHMLLSFLAGVPIAIGFLVGYVATRRMAAGTAGASALATLSVLLFVFAAGAWMREGFICILMATPILLLLAILGVFLNGLTTKGGRKNSKIVPLVLLAPLAGAPLEAQLPESTRLNETVRSIHIAAAPAVVWHHINQPVGIQPRELESGFAYRIGVPYPVEARTVDGRVGGRRTLKWQRGVEFEEIITAWEPERRIAWVYEFGPGSFPPGSLDDHIMIGGRYFGLEETSYTLEPEAGGTRLTIRVGARVSTHFNWYAGLWADYLVDDTARAILGFYKARSERGGA